MNAADKRILIIIADKGGGTGAHMINVLSALKSDGWAFEFIMTGDVPPPETPPFKVNYLKRRKGISGRFPYCSDAL